MFQQDPRFIEFLGHWAHSLVHCAKVLGRIGVRVPAHGELGSVRESMVEALGLIEDRPASDDIKNAIYSMTLRWLATGDLLAAYGEGGQDWRALAFLDSLNQVEGLVALAMAMLDDRDSAN